MLADVLRLVKRPKGQRIRRDEIETRAASYGRESSAYHKLMSACDLMRDVRRGGKRQNGEPWINHDRSVFLILFDYLGIRDVDLLVAALIHDMVEDSNGEYLVADVSRLFGGDVAIIVDAVTKPDREEYPQLSDDEFEELVFEKVDRGGFKARLLKYADRLHNMITLWGNKKKKAKKIRETSLFVVPMAIRDNVLWVELQAAMAFQTRNLRMQAKEIVAGAAA